jgi:hypothetical protein
VRNLLLSIIPWGRSFPYRLSFFGTIKVEVRFKRFRNYLIRPY